MPPDNPYFALIHAYEQTKTADVQTLCNLIVRHQMTWEMVPSQHPKVWEALAEHMPLTALIRNLATLTRVGAIAPMKFAWVCERLNAIGNPLTEDFTRIHPINVLSALLTYRSGKGARGHHTWIPTRRCPGRSAGWSGAPCRRTAQRLGPARRRPAALGSRCGGP